MTVTLYPAHAPLPDDLIAPWRDVSVALAVDCAPGAR